MHNILCGRILPCKRERESILVYRAIFVHSADFRLEYVREVSPLKTMGSHRQRSGSWVSNKPNLSNRSPHETGCILITFEHVLIMPEADWNMAVLKQAFKERWIIDQSTAANKPSSTGPRRSVKASDKVQYSPAIKLISSSADPKLPVMRTYDPCPTVNGPIRNLSLPSVISRQSSDWSDLPALWAAKAPICTFPKHPRKARNAISIALITYSC